MKRFNNLLLRVWREASRHIEIGESTATIAPLLGEHLPVEQVVVLRLDLQHGRLDAVANHALGSPGLPLPAHTELSPNDLRTLVSWGGTKEIIRRSGAGSRAIFDLIAAGPFDSEALAGPLWGARNMEGVLILHLAADAVPDPVHEQLAAALLEPFGAALEIDHHLRDVAALRERAEADRRSLLAKLGRKDLTSPMVGADSGLRHVMDRVEMISGSDVAVLLLGETGSGKEVVARAIHDRSERRDRPFIRVNCGAIPAELIDSQLFGHERGSFTGATDTHHGWFERADEGTLFLDEIGELPPAAQVRLLCVLQDGFIERIGGKHMIHVNVRIIAATNRDIAQMTRDGRFRQDLWYRIAVFPIPIPPLRERPEDISPLACHFAQKAATRFGLPVVMPTPDDLRLLAGYAWPGNVRELAAVVDRAALLGNGRRLEVAKSLGVTMGPEAAGVFGGQGGTTFGERGGATFGGRGVAAGPMPALDVPAGAGPLEALSLDDAIKWHIEAALQACHGRIEGPFGVARRLKVNPHTLRSRMRKLGIDWRRFRESRGANEPA
jgi:transcriptional regulator with GAF, ATPase, and Fis domain